MHKRRGRLAALAGAALLVTGSAMLVFPASASADTKTVPCGSEVEAKPGDRIKATDPLLGLPLDLGVVTETTNVLTGTINAVLGKLCEVTVTVIDTVVEPVPEVGDDAAKTLKDGTKKLTEEAKGTVNDLGSAVTPQQPQQPPSQNPDRKQQDQTNQQDSSGQQSADGTKRGDSGGTDGERRTIPPPNSPIAGQSAPLNAPFLPSSFGSGYAPMRDYSGIPAAQPGLYAPSPGVRYGSQVPGYQPEFGVLDSQGPKSADETPRERVSKAGEARALPGSRGPAGSPTSLPVLLAVIMLAGSTAGLVRTWVLRRS